jgi:hypothetical protein
MVLAGAQDFEDRIDPDVEREHTYADLLAEYESECAGVPCV